MKKNDLRVIEDELYNRESRRTKSEDYIFNQTPEVKTPNETMNYPDAKLHQVISFIKSGIRILACIAGVFGLIGWAFAGLAVAEIVGIIEELV
tara:strand:- start:421 stop:699 length:279 start_codon:yes stop_codon:yes gene_type:complete